MERTVQLSLRGMLNVPLSTYDNDFTFNLSDGTSWSCPRFIADFMSPRIAKIHETDTSFTSIDIDLPNCRESLLKLSKIALGQTLSINNIEHFIALAKLLENAEVIECLTNRLSNAITTSNVLDRLKIKTQIHADATPEINFIASNFSAMKTFFTDFSFEILYQIMGSSHLRLETEDELYLFTRDAVKGRPEWFPLFEHVDFSALSKASIADFIQFSGDYECSLNSVLWQRICQRMMLTEGLPVTKLEKRYEDPASGREVEYDKVNPLNGIIRSLSQESGGNAARCGSIEVLSSSYTQGRRPENLFDADLQNYFESQPKRYQWIIVDFKSLRVSPTRYTLGTIEGSGAPKMWVLDGSVDGVTWTLIDKRKNVKALMQDNTDVMFKTINQPYVRFIRLRQQCNNSGGDKLSLRAFEVFGKVHEWENTTVM